jgi:DNA-binding transcriptional regulator YiaG
MSQVTTVITSVSGTSSGGDMIVRSLRVICLTSAFYICGTHSAVASHSPSNDPASQQTNSGLTAEQKAPVGPAIMEIRRLSGMTWEQLASLFEVSRRTVHFWASGKALNSYNEEKLYRVLSTIRQIDRGIAQENRQLLFTARGGVLPIELIRTGHYEEVVRLVGETTFERPNLTSLSEAAWNTRRPVASPHLLVGSLQDRVQMATGRTRPARAVRAKKNKLQGDDS